MTEYLFTLLKNDEAYYQIPEVARHPLIFYYAHVAVFYINKLRVARMNTTYIDKNIETVCAIGVDEMDWDDLNPKHYNWPSVQDIRQYRKIVYNYMQGIINTIPLQLPITWQSPFWVILMGIEHERIHLETSSVLMRQLDIQYIRNPSIFTICKLYTVPDYFNISSLNNLLEDNNNICNRYKDINDTQVQKIINTDDTMIDIKGDTIYHDKNFTNQQVYGWDNEYGKLLNTVKSFKVSKYLVSNAEYYQFVCDNGYNREE